MGEDNRYGFYEKAPEGYNLLGAEREELDRYGIPPKPDANAEPRLFDFWTKLVSPPFHARRPTFQSMYRPAHKERQPQPEPQPGQHMFILDTLMRESPRDGEYFWSRGGTLQSSLNWSGAIISPDWPRRFILATAGWIAPKVRPAPAEAMYTSRESKVLVWVGLDGYNGRLPKISLPQIGTAHWPDGRYPHFAWWDWWRNPKKTTTEQPRRNAITMIKDFDVETGHEILAGLAVLVSHDILYFIKNQSTGQFRSFLAKQQPLGDIEPLGSSVEWVVERPTEPNSGDFHTLADYGSVDFKYCMAVAADGPVAPGRRLMTLADNGRMMKMRETFQKPYRVAHVSRANRRHDRDGSIGVTCTFHDSP
jgi:hypothetical protein